MLVSELVAVATGIGMPTTPAFIWLSAKLLRILGTPLPSRPDQTLMVWPLMVAPSRLIEFVGVLIALAVELPKPKAPESTELELLIVPSPLAVMITSPLSLMMLEPLAALMLALALLVTLEFPDTTAPADTASNTPSSVA